MSTVFLTSDGLSFNYSGNPFDDANNRILVYENILDDLTNDQSDTLYEEIQSLIDKMFSFDPKVTKIDFSKSSQEKYLYRARKLFFIFNKLKQRIDLDISFELHDIYANLLNDKNQKEPDEELISFRKVLSDYFNLSRQEIVKVKKQNKHEIRTSSIFKTALKFADKNGIYALKDKPEFIKKNGITNFIALSIYFFGDKSCRTQIGYTLNKRLEDIDENIDINNKRKHIYYSLKNNHLFNTEFFNFIESNNTEIHPTFKQKLEFYKIKKLKRTEK